MKSALLAVSLAAIVMAGCGGHAAAPIAPQAPASLSQAVTVIPFDDAGIVATAATVGARLTGESPIVDKRYGRVLGYFKGTTSFTSQVVTLLSAHNVVFKNVDTIRPHTVSFLGKATSNSAPWPASFTGSFTQSKAGTAIGTKSWSTGSLNPGKTSLVYSTGAPGFYMVGCGFHYVSSGMRTVIIVQ